MCRRKWKNNVHCIRSEYFKQISRSDIRAKVTTRSAARVEKSGLACYSYYSTLISYIDFQEDFLRRGLTNSLTSIHTSASDSHESLLRALPPFTIRSNVIPTVLTLCKSPVRRGGDAVPGRNLFIVHVAGMEYVYIYI